MVAADQMATTGRPVVTMSRRSRPPRYGRSPPDGCDQVAAHRAVATRSRASEPSRSQLRPNLKRMKLTDDYNLCLQGEMRALVSWILVLVVYLAFPRFQRDRLDEMGFGEVLRMEWMRADAPLTQALRSRWDAEANAFVLPWGHMIPNLEDVSRITGLRVYGHPVSSYTYPCYRELAHRLLDLTIGQRSSLISRVELQESLGVLETGRRVAESVDEQLQRLAEDLDLHRFLIRFFGRLLFATRGDPVHFRFLPLLEDLGEVGSYAWGAAFLAHQFESLGSSDRQTAISGFYHFLQVWAYLHLPGLRRGILERPDVVPLARRWVPCRDTHPLKDHLASL
ncbi:hypothetical protein Taro_024813 [Colocasia esculenta]|uniref:Aminotransferase-like plant mobile domain-containing protein n=1 Tax=Colocasia esculenta TaxID=4460 RepID=A0A843VEQ3_COLES|nr:hypothetical protein [Colocasia esculenta]